MRLAEEKGDIMDELRVKVLVRMHEIRDLLRSECGQGTTEYAILVGVLVVIAIIAIIAFRGKVQELWDAIVSGMNSL